MKRQTAKAGPATDQREVEEKIRQLGLRRVRAYVRPQLTSGARRTSKHRAKQQAHGLRQMNVIVPDGETARRAIAAAAKRITDDVASAEFILRAAENENLAGQSQLSRRIWSWPVAFVGGAILGYLGASLF